MKPDVLDVIHANIIAKRILNEGGGLADIIKKEKAGEMLSDKERRVLEKLQRPISLREVGKVVKELETRA